MKLYWKFIRFELIFSMSGFGYSSNSGLKQKRSKWNLTEDSARGSIKHFASITLLKVKIYWFSSGLQSNTFHVKFLFLLLDIILKSLFSTYTDKNHNPVCLLAWNCFMKIIICVFITNYRGIMGTCPECSNFSQGISRVQLREPQVELGTQIPLGYEQK